MTGKGPLLKSGESFGLVDQLTSPSSCFFASLSDTGQLSIYRGAPPPNDRIRVVSIGNPAPKGPKCLKLWENGEFFIYNGKNPEDGKDIYCSGSAVSLPGPKCLYLHDDGVIRLYNGWDPGEGTKIGPDFGHADRVDKVIGISRIDFDLDHATTTSTEVNELYRQTVRNYTDEPQDSMIKGEQSVQEMSGWSNAIGVTIGAETSFKTGIPVLAEGKITVSASVTDTYQCEHSTTRTSVWGFETTVCVPPHRAILALVAVSLSTISVPYTMTAIVRLASGVVVPNAQIKGLFTGKNCHDLIVTYVDQDPVTGRETRRTEALNGRHVRT